MSKFVTRLLPLLLFVFFHSNNAGAQQPDRPPNLSLGDAVVSGFSGTLAPDASKPRLANKSATDLTFINPDGPAARIIDIARPGYVWDGRLFPAPKTFDVFAKDVGQVFGVALDDATPPNIYLAATSAFGLQIVGRGRDGLAERRKKGGPGTGWMKGQFGLELQGGPGAIYKVDGRTGAVSLFANVTLDGVPNPGTGLGNLAYDSAHKQLFVSDLYTGTIHRFDLDGKELGRYDHGVTGLGAAKLAAVPFNPRNRPNIASDRFDSEKPDSWGFAPAARRVWGLAVNEGRLYYSVMSGPQIWSVGITRDGDFAADPRWELDVPAQAGPLPISDIAFSQQGAMILAQRALIAGAYDYSAFTQPGEPQVLRVWLKVPNDPPSPGRWKLTPEEYAVGFSGNNRNTNGGVALGYGYGADGMLSTTVCEAALWTTGQNLRNNPALRSQLEPGGPLLVHGLQGAPADMVRNANTPPAISYFVDYDDKFDDARAAGHMGSVRIFAQPCAGSVATRPVAPVNATLIGTSSRPQACTPTCICPNGGVLKDGKCVEVCPPPQIFDPATGDCKCPPRTVLRDGKCVPILTIAPPHECLPPLVLDPLTGLCVPAKHECLPPLVLDPVTGACVCPPGSVMQDGKCVPQICPSPLVPGPCQCPEGTVQDGGLCIRGSIIVKKEVTTDGTLIPWPNPGPLFPMTLTCIAPPQSWSFSLTNNGTYTANNIPFGKTCTVAEGPMPPFPPNLCPRGSVPAWLPLPFTTPASVVINGTTVTMVVHNSVTCVKAELAVTKKVSPDPRGIGNTLIFHIVATCSNPSATYNLNVNGNTSTLPFAIPVNSNCFFTETLPALPKGCTWLAPIFSPANVPIAPGLNLETVTNGYRCEDVCPPPQVMNIDGICVCPPPMVAGAVPGTCRCPDGTVPVGGACVPVSPPPPVCPPPQVMNVDGICGCPPPMVTGATPGTCVCTDGTTLVDGKCVPVDSCQPPQIFIPGVGCGCPDGMVLVDGTCVKKLVCDSPLVPNAAGTACVRKPTEKKKTRAARECKNGQVMVSGKCREPEQRSRDIERLPQIRIPGGFGGGRGPGGGGGVPQGGGGPVTPGRR